MQAVEVRLANINDLEEQAEITTVNVRNYALTAEDTTIIFPPTKDNNRPTPEALQPIKESIFADEAALSLRIMEGLIFVRHTPGKHTTFSARALRGLRTVVGDKIPINDRTLSA